MVSTSVLIPFAGRAREVRSFQAGGETEPEIGKYNSQKQGNRGEPGVGVAHGAQVDCTAATAGGPGIQRHRDGCFSCRLGRFVVLFCSGGDDDVPVCRFSLACLLGRYCFEISAGPYEDVGTQFPGVVMCQGQRQLQWKLATTALEWEQEEEA